MSQCKKCDLLIANDLESSLISHYNKKLLKRVNHNITENVTKIICPNFNIKEKSFITYDRLIKYKIFPSIRKNELCFVTLDRVDPKRNNSKNIAPSNTILYGTTICNQLLDLNILGLKNEDIRKLDEKFDIVWPWSVQFNSDRLGNNKRVQNFPLMIVYPREDFEVTYWVKFCKNHFMTPSMRSGGHSYECFSNGGQLIIDLTHLEIPHRKKCGRNQIFVDTKYRTVDVSPGVRLGPLYGEVAKKGFQIAGGICPSVCIGGYITGGGVGYFLRKYGYGCDSLLKVDVVLADGKLITATAKNRYSDLFKSVKGAGWAGLGVITRYRLRVYSSTKLVFYSYNFDIADKNVAVKVISQLQIMSRTAPDNLSSMIGNVIAGLPVLNVNGIYMPKNKTPIPEFKYLIKNQLFDHITPIEPIDTIVKLGSWLDLDTFIGFQAPQIPNYKIRSSFVFTPLNPTNITSILTYLDTPPVSTTTGGGGTLFSAIQYLIFGGRVNEINPNSSVMSARAGTVGWIQMAMYYSDSNDVNTAFNYVNGLYEIVTTNGGSLIADPNVPDLLLTDYLTSYWGSENVSFLEKVKSKYDPTNLFKGPQTIPVQ